MVGKILLETIERANLTAQIVFLLLVPPHKLNPFTFPARPLYELLL